MTTKELLEANYRKEYERLNDEQRKAVEAIDGPVMVIAGPGTGKTQILAMRIGRILQEPDVLPENILCLTYTDSGVVAMRRRLKSFIGADAYRVSIYTFHAFCNDIIQTNLSYFEKTSLDAISDLESIELFKELIDGLEKGNPLKRYRGDVYYEIGNLRSLFGNMKREGWTVEKIEKAIDEFIEEIKNCDESSDYYATFKYRKKIKDKNVGDLKPAFDELLERMEKLRAAIYLFEKYQKMMRSRNRYDFDDMINWVLQAFKENANLLARYQEQYQYVLVDEYQDTSGTQNALVQMLIGYWDKPNVFVVGDDDQSIYRFQGANMENMIEFANQQLKNNLKTIVLTKNYRSVQPVLDLAKALIDGNAERLVKKLPGLSKDLEAANEKIKTIHIQPKLLQYETQFDEMLGIAQSVESLIGKGIEPNRISVIYKEHKYGDALAKFFQQKNIPFYSKKTDNVFFTPFGRKLLKILEYLNAELDTPYGGDEMLFEILHFDWLNIPPLEIAKLSVEVADRQFGKDATSLRKLLHDKAHAPQKDLFSTAPHAGLRFASDALETLIADVHNYPLQQLFEQIIVQFDLLSYLTDSPEKFRLLKILTALFNFIKEETARNPLLNLKQLTAMIKLMRDENIAIPIVEISGSEKGVNLLTAHGSKGLEFQYVFFAGCVSSVWEKKKNPNSGYAFPDTLFVSVSKEKELEELRRLFYVAVTRAEQYLFVSYYRFNAKNKEEEPTQFIAEMQERQAFEEEDEVFIPQETKEEFQLLEFSKRQAPELPEFESYFINDALENFALSVTALNNFIKCPLSFYYNQILRMPAAKSESLVFGSAVHYALEKLFSKMLKNDDKIFPEKPVFIGDFEWYMKRHRENFLQEDFNRRMEHGREILSNYYEKYGNNWNKIVVVERMIKNVTVNGVPLKGKLDKLEFSGKNVNVVDYKTGDFEKAKEKLKAPDEKNLQGGDYWRQAVFYKILLDHANTDWQAISTEFDFIEPNKKKEYQKRKFVITPQDMDTVERQISDVWQRIQNRDFYTGCGKEDCVYCNMVKDNRLYIALHDEEEV